MQMTLFTRNESYKEVLKDLTESKARVYRALYELKKASNREISEYLHLPINCITGRCKELRESGAVIEAGVKFDSATNRNVTVFKIAD